MSNLDPKVEAVIRALARAAVDRDRSERSCQNIMGDPPSTTDVATKGATDREDVDLREV